jgi:NAD+ diphosphatase
MSKDHAMVTLFWRGKPFVSKIKNLTSGNNDANQSSPAWFSFDFFKKRVLEQCEIIFLGLLNEPKDMAFFSIDISEISNPEEELGLKDLGSFEDLMLLAPQAIDAGELAMLGQAKGIFEWNNSHKFCSKCGGKSDMHEAGYKRICNNCSTEHFPRTDPVVIMLAKYENTAFLGRQKRFPPGMYSALAGFIEHGESIEEAVARELKEEAGIKILDAKYHSSQPWPFPNSLMIGCIADAESNQFKLDEVELDEGRWFNREELRDALNGGSKTDFFVPPPMAIAHHLVKAFVEQD